MKNIFIFFILTSMAMLTHAQSFRTIDGFGNNLERPESGAAGSVLAKWTQNGFTDSIQLPGGIFRPNARVVSNQLFRQEGPVYDAMDRTEFVWAFGQFIDHDITLVIQDHKEPLPVIIPSNDSVFEPGSKLLFFRSYGKHGSGESVGNPRIYENEVTSFIDGSMIYGSDEKRSNYLRTFERGRLKISAGKLMAWNTTDNEFNSPVDPLAPGMDNETGTSKKWFIAGDTRANEHPLLISLHTLFVREHNRLCDSLSALYPHWNDELIYQSARKTVGALLQSIVYNEWLPAMGIEIDEDLVYDPALSPGISNVFSAAAFRLGHTLINDDILRLEKNGDTIIQGNIKLRDAFFDPLLIPQVGGIEPYLLGIASRKQQSLDCKVVDGVRNFLFGNPGSGGLDLVVMNIMRGRDRGLPDYNTIRENIGLEKYETFEQITQNEDILYQLNFLYGNVDNIDPWVGMLAEDPLQDKMMGQLLYEILLRQFTLIRQGDRFFFENDPGLSFEEKEEIRTTSLSDIIRRNTNIESIRENVFIYEKPIDIEAGPPLVTKQLDAAIYPVPVRDELKIKYFLTREEEVSFTLYDLLGHQIINTTEKGNPGNNFSAMFFQGLVSPGYYVLTLETKDAFNKFKVLLSP